MHACIQSLEEAARGPFNPTKIIVLSELTTREKEQYYNLMIRNSTKFHRDSNGRIIGNIRLLAPNVRKIENEPRKKDSSNYSITFQERLSRLKQNGFIDVNIVGSDNFEFNSYPRFTALIAFDGDTVKPRARPLSWVMKIVEDIYDYRFSHEKNDVAREEESPSFDLMLLIFPVFVVRRLGTNVGLKTLVDQTCWDLLYNTHVYRRDYLELEVFARFLQEFYDHDDLLFFLYVRSVVAKVLHVSFKSRWTTKCDGPGRQPKSLWMSYRECIQVAKIVFGADNEDMLRDFMYLIGPQMLGQRTESSDSRRMDITEFLHLSVVGYHQTQSRSQGSAAAQRMLVPIPGQVTAPEPAPQPFEDRNNSEINQHSFQNNEFSLSAEHQQQFDPNYDQQQNGIQQPEEHHGRELEENEQEFHYQRERGASFTPNGDEGGDALQRNNEGQMDLHDLATSPIAHQSDNMYTPVNQTTNQAAVQFQDMPYQQSVPPEAQEQRTQHATDSAQGVDYGKHIPIG